MKHSEGKTVLVAMSGGVDSSVAAAVLLEKGYRVFGVTMLLWPEVAAGAREGCCGSAHLNDAREVCHRLGISHYTLDLQKEFLSQVVDPFVAAYLGGRTPNPCIACNEHLKFRHLLRKGLGIGADLLATGHYARITGEGPYLLNRGIDREKDQTYFLFPLAQGELSRLVFPLGEMTKEQARSKAAVLGLPVHQKPESQEICFIPNGGLREFIRARAPEIPGPGDIVDMTGRVVGRHEGACFYTVGQRRGLGISSTEPLYVVRIDIRQNVLIVGNRLQASFTGLTATDISWVSGKPPASSFESLAQIRHRHVPARCKVHLPEDGGMKVVFEQPQHGVAPGQAVVLYDGEVVLGGGWITGSSIPG